MGTFSRRVIACLGVVTLGLVGLTACKDDNSPQEPPPTSSLDEPASTNPGNSSDAEVEVEATDTADRKRQPAGLPDDFPNIGVPFYYPSELVASPSDADPWVLEFVTDHELTIVNNTIANEFSEQNGWRDVTREVDGQLTVTTGNIDGYLLVIAVASEPSDDFKTSLYYTLSTQ